MEFSEYLVYRGQYQIGFGMPFVITTSLLDETGAVKTEYFIFVVGESNIFRAQKFKLSSADVLSDKANEVRASFSEAVLVEAETKLSYEISNFLGEDASDSPGRGNLSLEKVDKCELLSLKLTGDFEDELQLVSQESNCEDLKGYLGLLIDVEITSSGFPDKPSI